MKKNILASLVLGTFTKTKLLKFSSLVFSLSENVRKMSAKKIIERKKRHGKKKKKAPNVKIQRFHCLKIVV